MCTCLTEQGTRYELSQPECRTLAHNGPVYNPCKATQPPAPAPPMPAVAGQRNTVGIPGAVISRGERANGSISSRVIAAACRRAFHSISPIAITTNSVALTAM